MQDRKKGLQSLGVALVTGASRGIGRAVVRKLAQEGFDVVALARSFPEGAFAGVESRVQTVSFDLYDVERIGEMVDALGPVSVLVNNAGVMHALTWKDYPDDMRERSLRVNLVAPVELMRAVAPGMMERRGGAVVNVASIAGYIGHPDVWYGATKAALINATKSFALQLGAYGVTVNAVAPGPVETDMLAVIPKERQERLRAGAVTGRFATADEVADAVLSMLFCPHQVTGAILDVCAAAVLR